MKHWSRLILLLFIMLSLPSCITLTDELTVNEDGSGMLKLSLDLGMVAGAVNGDNAQFDLSFLDKVKEISSNARELLKDAQGITDVQATTNEKGGYYEVSMKFDQAKHLNTALYKLFGQNKSFGMPSLIKISRHKIVKKNLSPYLQKAFKSTKVSSANELVYSYIRLNSIMHLPSEIQSAKNIRTTMDNTRTASTSFTLQEMLDGKFDGGNIIRY